VTAAAAAAAAVLFLAIAAFQVALALGAPLGAHVLGGRNTGSLANRLRLVSMIAAVLLVAAAIVVLARVSVIGWPAEAAGLLPTACWIIPGYMALNTLGNLMSKCRFERTILAAATAALSILSASVALS